MKINYILREKRLSMYKLSQLSGVPQSTINDLCSGRTSIEKCTAGNLKKLAEALGTTMEELMEEDDTFIFRESFETFKGNICHRVKDVGDIEFIIETLKSDEIRRLYERQQNREALYLLAMVDYLSRENDLPICTDYEDMRRQKLKEPQYPLGVETLCAVTGDDKYKEEAISSAIPEFMRFNIVESEVRNVC